MSWLEYGLRGGILTTHYPHGDDRMPDAYRGEIEFVESAHQAAAGERIVADVCLSHAIADEGGSARVDSLRCFRCGECTRVAPERFLNRNHFEVARVAESPASVLRALRKRLRSLGRSIHLRHVDAGSDGSEEQELNAIFNPFYDANRLGVFLTASPRHADMLVVTGAVTKPMLEPLQRTFAAMPSPKVVIALGTTACSGGIFRDRPEIVGPVDAVLPVDVWIPGAPPSPLSILHGIWVALGHTLAHGEVGA